MQKKLNVKLMKSGSENDVITRMIANYNQGKVDCSPRDLEGYLITRNAMFPTINNYKLVKDNEEPNTYHVSEDRGKTFTLSIEWVEVFELPEVDEEIETELAGSNDDLKNIL